MSKTNQQHQPRNKVTYIPHPLPTEGYVRKPSILAALGVSSTTFDNYVKSGRFPPGKLLTARCRVWPVAEIRALLVSIENGEAA